MKTVYIQPPFGKTDEDKRVSVPMEDFLTIMSAYETKPPGSKMEITYKVSMVLQRWQSYISQMK